MSQLKPSFINDILEALGKTRFTKDDFDIQFPDSGHMLARINFRHKPEYFLVLRKK